MEDLAEFWRLANKVGEVLQAGGDDHAAEPYLIKILRIAESRPNERDSFTKAFLRILDNPDKWSVLIVEFCMHRLRYLEIQTHWLERLKSERFCWEDMHARHVLEAYSQNWPRKACFQYYLTPD